MKLRKIFWMGLLLIPLFACEDPDTTMETKAELRFTIPLNSSELKSTEAESYSFSGFVTFCLANKDNAQNCPDNILQVMPDKGSVLMLPYFDGEINTLNLEWGYGELGSDVFEMQNAIPLLSGENMSSIENATINLDGILNPIILQMDKNPNTYIKLVITGKANCCVSSEAKMVIPIIVEYEALSPRIML